MLFRSRRGDEGVLATPDVVPDAAVDPMKSIRKTKPSKKKNKKGGGGGEEEGGGPAAELDPITARVVGHAQAMRSEMPSADTPMRVRVLDWWWERDNWCLLLEKI